MVKRLIAILLVISTQLTWAIEGTIVVLEAPIFKKPDEKSRVVQYYRKGDTIFIHSNEAFVDEFAEEEIEIVEGVKADEDDDPLIGNKLIYYPSEDSTFYKTVSRNGKEAYILKEHVYINYKDSREFTQTVIKHDHTDYRIEEPLPKHYPLIYEEGYRGVTQLAFGRANYKAYPYPGKIVDIEHSFSSEFNFIWSRIENVIQGRRFFFGYMGGIHLSEIKFLLDDKTAKQENIRLSAGPFISYDIYRTEKDAFNIYTSSQFYLLDRMKITVSSRTFGEKEERAYNSYIGFSQVIGANYQKFKNFYTFDTVIGVNGRINSPRTYTTNSSGNENNYWNSTAKSDSYLQPLTAEVSLYFGLQSYY